MYFYNASLAAMPEGDRLKPDGEFKPNLVNSVCYIVQASVQVCYLHAYNRTTQTIPPVRHIRCDGYGNHCALVGIYLHDLCAAHVGAKQDWIAQHSLAVHNDSLHWKWGLPHMLCTCLAADQSTA